MNPHEAIMHAPKVFSAPCLERLAALTNAERELRGMGLPVIWSRLAGPLPQVHIRRAATTSVVPLLNRAKARSFCVREEDGRDVVSVEFEGVIVSWIKD